MFWSTARTLQYQMIFALLCAHGHNARFDHCKTYVLYMDHSDLETKEVLIMKLKKKNETTKKKCAFLYLCTIATIFHWVNLRSYRQVLFTAFGIYSGKKVRAKQFNVNIIMQFVHLALKGFYILLARNLSFIYPKQTTYSHSEKRVEK